MKYHRNVPCGGVYHEDQSLPPSLGILYGNLKHTREVIIEMY